MTVYMNTCSKENVFMDQLQLLTSEQNVPVDKVKTTENLSEDLVRMHMSLAKGAFIRSRAKWLEEGAGNSSYFFSSENGKQENK